MLLKWFRNQTLADELWQTNKNLHCEQVTSWGLRLPVDTANIQCAAWWNEAFFLSLTMCYNTEEASVSELISEYFFF